MMSSIALSLLVFLSVEQESADVDALMAKATAAARQQKFGDAQQWVGKAIAKKPDESILYYIRGRYRFQASQIQKSLEDFDKYVKLVPGRASRQWERGITCYYAKAYKKGAAQFELYQTFF